MGEETGMGMLIPTMPTCRSRSQRVVWFVNSACVYVCQKVEHGQGHWDGYVDAHHANLQRRKQQQT
jgi:hypothetical protein